MADDLVQRLRRNVLSHQEAAELADEIERLRACLKYEEHRFATQSTHSEGCHSFGPRHYECALQEVESLRAEVAEAKRRASNAERELAELRERIEKAPVAETWETDWGGRAPNSLVADVPAAIGEGKRVRLVLEGDT